MTKPEIQHEIVYVDRKVVRYRPCPEDQHEFTMDEPYGYCQCGAIAIFHERTFSSPTASGHQVDESGPVQQVIAPEALTHLINAAEEVVRMFDEDYISSDMGPLGTLYHALKEL
tara:strand:- start:683 stop:1024 length:342 start_codon:yes stop_codon:yes gene_type:complete